MKQHPIDFAIQQLLPPHFDNQGEIARLAMLYGKMPFVFLETKLRFDQMKDKVSDRLHVSVANDPTSFNVSGC